jgi:hypothetical protein
LLPSGLLEPLTCTRSAIALSELDRDVDDVVIPPDALARRRCRLDMKSDHTHLAETIAHEPEKSLCRDEILVAISESGLIASSHVSHPFRANGRPAVG